MHVPCQPVDPRRHGALASDYGLDISGGCRDIASVGQIVCRYTGPIVHNRRAVLEYLNGNGTLGVQHRLAFAAPENERFSVGLRGDIRAHAVDVVAVG